MTTQRFTSFLLYSLGGRIQENRGGRSLWLQIVPGNKFETFIQKDDGQGYLDHHEPMMQVQVCQFEDHRQGVNVKDDKMQRHGEADRSQKPDVHPGRHPYQGLVL
uniref:Uncharacterized protein n=1 Tax=Micrurus paraensis TaxID=1970185 RepID=A0A2D4KLR7_9SAUR